MHFKRILSLVLMFCLLAVLPPIYAMASSVADDGWQTWENIRWSFDESSQTLTIAGEGDMPEAGYFMDFPWYGLGEKVKDVRVEEGITSIAVDAFRGLAIENLYLPETLQRYESYQPAANVHVPNVPIEFADGSIGVNTNLVFEGENPNFFITEEGSVYNAERTRLFHAKPVIGSFVLPDTIEELDSSAFVGAHKLVNNQWQPTQIVFPENCKITEIKDSTFQAINGVKNLVLPEGIEKIGRMAFCHAMNVSIPKTVRQIEDDSFWQAGEVTVDPENPYFSDDGHGALLDKNQTLLYHVPSSAERYDIPNTVKTVMDKAFNACQWLEKVVIPESVTELGDGLFMNCDSLRSVVIMNWNCKFDPNTFALAGISNDGINEGDDVYIEVYGYPGSTTEDYVAYAVDYRAKHKENPEEYGWRFPNFTFKKLDTHQVEDGGNLQVGQGGEQALQFHVTDVNDLDQFTEVFVDCELVSPNDYALKEGSVIVEFNEDYLNSLSGGEHVINAVFKDGGATGKITVDAATYEVKYQDPVWAGSTENGMMIATDARFDTLLKIMVDGVELDPKDYTIDNNSFAAYHTVILSPEYLKSLTNGEHTIKFIYTHGEGDGSFQVGFKNDIPTTSGSASVWKDQDPDVTVEMEGDPDKILNFYMNGDIVDPDYFDVTEEDGVIQIKVSQELLGTLEPGDYVFHVLFENGDAEFKITVNPEKIKPGEPSVDPQEPVPTPNPGSASNPSSTSKTENPEGPARTADMGMPVAAFAVMVLALGDACWLLTSKKTKH